MPKSIPHLVLGKVRQVLVTEVPNSDVLVQNVHNKSLSQELNTVLFCSFVNGMDVTILTTSFRLIFTVTLV